MCVTFCNATSLKKNNTGIKSPRFEEFHIRSSDALHICIYLLPVPVLQDKSFPTPSGITEAMAINTCRQSIMASSLASRCMHMPDVNMQLYVDSCVEDMKVCDVVL